MTKCIIVVNCCRALVSITMFQDCSADRLIWYWITRNFAIIGAHTQPLEECLTWCNVFDGQARTFYGCRYRYYRTNSIVCCINLQLSEVHIINLQCGVAAAAASNSAKHTCNHRETRVIVFASTSVFGTHCKKNSVIFKILLCVSCVAAARQVFIGVISICVYGGPEKERDIEGQDILQPREMHLINQWRLY